MSAPLRHALDSTTARVAVVGLGVVGLAVAAAFAEAGFRVTGIDRVPEKVACVSAGRLPLDGDEPGLAPLLAAVVASGQLRATTDATALGEADVVILAVDTPLLAGTRGPDERPLRAALDVVGAHLRPGMLVIIESTLAPGTTEGLAKPLLEQRSGLVAERDFFLVHCPERVMPGRLLHNLRAMDRVVGGLSPAGVSLAVSLYRHVVRGRLDGCDALTAELVKTAENAYRDVQIAFANELAMLCEGLGADVWKVRELVNRSPGRNVLLPGGGVGGHCIPKDPWLMVAGAAPSFLPRLTAAARAVNDGMPRHVAGLVSAALARRGVALAGATVVVLGYAYLENSGDTRNSPSEALVAALEEEGASVRIVDPWIPAFQGDLEEVAAGAHALVLMVNHDAWRSLPWEALARLVRLPLLIDSRGAVDTAALQAAGFEVVTLGRGV